MSNSPVTITTAGPGIVAYSYGEGPALGVVRIGTRNGVACYLQADRVDAPATSRNAWSYIGPVADYADHAAAADAYASQHQATRRAAGLATMQQPVQQAQAQAMAPAAADASRFTVWRFSNTAGESNTVARYAEPDDLRVQSEYQTVLWQGRATSREDALVRAGIGAADAAIEAIESGLIASGAIEAPAPFVALGTVAAAVVASAAFLMPSHASAAPWAPDLFRDGDALANAAIGVGMVAVYAFGAAAVLAGCAAAATALGEGVRLPVPTFQVRAPRLPALPWPKLPAVSFKRVGGLRFVKVGRLSVSWSLARPVRVAPRRRPLAEAWSRFAARPSAAIVLAAAGGTVAGFACGCLALFV